MRESQFIEQNQAKWEEFEALFDRGRTKDIGKGIQRKASTQGPNPQASPRDGSAARRGNDPGRLRRLYVEITEDLAYARTFYPNRSVRVYLNHLGQRVVQRIHAAKPRDRSWKNSGFRRFWVEDLPRVLYDARLDIFLALVVFLVSLGIGILSSVHDNSFAQLILGQQYVDMTEANIEKGDPMYVYKDSEPFPMFVQIASNNLFVDAITFAAGAVFAVGAMFVLLVNGIMVGAFQYFFVEFDLFQESFLTIWQHGTLEMSAAVLSGAAGMSMGRGLVFPGTYSRMQAFRLSARRAVKIMALVVPMTLVAAVIESWVTRMTDLPDLIRAASIALSLFLVLGYVWWYPRLRARQGWPNDGAKVRLPAPRPQDMRLAHTHSAGELFAMAFAVYRRMLPFWLPRLLLVCGILGIAAGLLSDWVMVSDLWFYRMPFAGNFQQFLFSMSEYLNLTAQFGNTYSDAWLLPFQVFGVYAALHTILRGYGMLLREQEPERFAAPRWQKHFGLLFLALVQCAVLLLPKPWGKVLFVALLPLTTLGASAFWFEARGLVDGLQRAWGLIGGSIGTLFGAYLAAALMGFIGVWLINSPLMGLMWQILEQNFIFDEQSAMSFRVGTIVFMAFTAFFLVFPLSLAALVGSFFHAREAREAKGLQRAWSAFGERQNRWV